MVNQNKYLLTSSAACHPEPRRRRRISQPEHPGTERLKDGLPVYVRSFALLRMTPLEVAP